MNDKSANKALKSGIWYTISNFLSRAIGFISTPIFTRLLTKDEIGNLANFTSWLSILGIVSTFDLFTSVTIAQFDFREKLDDYITSNLLLGTLITGIFIGITNINHNFWLRLFSLSEIEYRLIFIYLLVFPALQMMQAKSRITYKYKLSVLLSLLSAFGSTLISLVCVLIYDDKYSARIFGYVVPLIFINAVIYVIYVIKNHEIRLSYCKYALIVSFPLIWHSLANTLLNSSDRVMIKSICSNSDTALYSIAYTCSNVVQILWTSLNTAWSPWSYEKMNENDTEALNKATKPYLVFFGVIVIGFLLIAPELLLLMGGKDYLPALSVIPPVMIAYVLQFAYSLYVNIEFYFKKQKWIAMGTIIAAAINIGLNYLLIPVFGYIAAAYTTLIGYITMFLMHYFIVERLGLRYFCPNTFVFKFIGVFIVIIPIILLLYELIVLKVITLIVLIVLFVFVIVRNRQSIEIAIKSRNLLMLSNLRIFK